MAKSAPKNYVIDIFLTLFGMIQDRSMGLSKAVEGYLD